MEEYNGRYYNGGIQWMNSMKKFKGEIQRRYSME